MSKLTSPQIIAPTLLLLGAMVTANAVEKSNVVIFLVDDWGSADVPWSDSVKPDVSLPKLADLRNDGVIATTSYITYNICAASRAGLLTGAYQNRFGLYNNNVVDGVGLTNFAKTGQVCPINGAEQNLAKILKGAGYRTAMFGKWHLGAELPVRNIHTGPMAAGFDKADYFNGAAVACYFFLSSYWSGQMYDNLTYVNPLADSQINDSGAFLTRRWTDKALTQINALETDSRPLFLYAAYNAVHAGLNDPKDADAPTDGPGVLRPLVTKNGTEADTSIGSIVSRLKAINEFNNTLFIFLSDNGGVTGEDPDPLLQVSNNLPLRGGKHYVEEGGIRTPFLMVYKNGNLPAGGTYNNSPVTSLDIVPTVLHAAGINTAGMTLDGTDLLPAFLTAGSPTEDQTPIQRTRHQGALVWSGGSDKPSNSDDIHGEGFMAIRGANNYKLIIQQSKMTMYNLGTDPNEGTNLLASPTPDANQKFVDLYAQYIAWQDDMPNPLMEDGTPGDSDTSDRKPYKRNPRYKNHWSMYLPMVKPSTTFIAVTGENAATERNGNYILNADIIQNSVSLRSSDAPYAVRTLARIALPDVDQDGAPQIGNGLPKILPVQPAITWSLISGLDNIGANAGKVGSLNLSNGIFTPGTTTGNVVVKATATFKRKELELNPNYNRNDPNSHRYNLVEKDFTRDSFLLIKVTGENQVNNPPTNAQISGLSTITLPITTVSLTGSATDPGDTLTYTWTGSAGVTFTGTGATITAHFPSGTTVATNYTITLVVKDSLNQPAPAIDKTITVNPPVNNPPTNPAISGLSAITLPITTVTLTGSATDPGDTLTYTWTGSAGVTFTGTGATVTAHFPSGTTVATNYTITLVVKDSLNQPAPAIDKTITVNPPVNNPPTNPAISGLSAITLPTTTVSLTGSATDPGDTLTYTWTGSAGVTFTGTGANVTAHFPSGTTVATNYTITLVVKDSLNQPAPAINKTITVNPEATATTPGVSTPANAGTQTETTIVLNVVGTDNSSPSDLIYTWSTTSGSGVTFSSNGLAESGTTTATFTQAGTYIFEVTIKDPVMLESISGGTVTVTVSQVLKNADIVVPTIAPGETKTLTVVLTDQFGNPFAGTPPTVTWSISGDGSIDAASGAFTAGSAPGTVVVTVSAGGGAAPITHRVTVTPVRTTPPPKGNSANGGGGCGLGSGLSALFLSFSAFMLALVRGTKRKSH